MTITPINPDTLVKNPVFHQAGLVEGGRTLYIGGQNGVKADGSLAGPDLGSQTDQIYKNILEILKTVGASQRNVVRMTIYVAKGQSLNEGLAAAQKVWGNHPAAISVLFVESVGAPGRGLPVEIDAIAVVD